MNKVYHFISIAVMSFAAIGCIEDIHTDMPSAERGDEVQFGLSLDGPKTKTVYGMEANNAFPVYWVDGDKVAVYSPDCLAGRNSAEYQVSVSEAKNYADQLTKTGEVGVQWGNSDNATFYSIYPSANATISGTGDDVTATLNIPGTQMLTHTLIDGTYYASDMNSVIMYAKKEASKSDAAVNLQYTPYSTVIEFELNGDFTTNTKASLFIESLTLTATAPATTEGAAAPYLAGNFNFRFTDTPEISASGNNRSNVTLQFSTQPELNNTNKTLKAKMCLMPIGVASLDGWTVSVTLREGDNTTKTLVKTLKTKANESTALNAGQVHKIKLPALTATKEWTYTPAAWLPALPEYKKIYLSELSLPGAWYAGAPIGHGYQATQSISDLWNAGVRAFAVETRTATNRLSANPNNVVVSGTGNNSVGTYNYGTNSLYNDSHDRAKVYNEGTNISTIITNIANAVSEDEFGVLILSYADGGSGGQRYVDHGAWLNQLYNVFNGLNSNVKNKIYQSQVTKNTTIEDVLGKLIIKINIDKRIAMQGFVGSNTYTYANNLPALFSYNPFLTQVESSFSNLPLFSKLYWKEWSDTETHRSYSSTYDDNTFMWCFSSANRTHTDGTGTYEIPTYAQRISILKAMMNYSRQIHDSSNHNIWFYFNVGGTQTTSLTDDTDDDNGTNAKNFAREMNPWLLDIIKRKIDGYTDESGVTYPSDPSPLGIVMFNQCTGSTTKENKTTKGADIIRAIIEMNNKFKLKREGGLENTTVGIDSWDTELL